MCFLELEISSSQVGSFHPNVSFNQKSLTMSVIYTYIGGASRIPINWVGPGNE